MFHHLAVSSGVKNNRNTHRGYRVHQTVTFQGHICDP